MLLEHQQFVMHHVAAAAAACGAACHVLVNVCKAPTSKVRIAGVCPKDKPGCLAQPGMRMHHACNLHGRNNVCKAFARCACAVGWLHHRSSHACMRITRSRWQGCGVQAPHSWLVSCANCSTCTITDAHARACKHTHTHTHTCMHAHTPFPTHTRTRAHT